MLDGGSRTRTVAFAAGLRLSNQERLARRHRKSPGFDRPKYNRSSGITGGDGGGGGGGDDVGRLGGPKTTGDEHCGGGTELVGVVGSWTQAIILIE